MAEINDPKPGDNSNWLLLKILRRLKDILTATEAPASIGDVTLTASDIEIGAVELKNGSDDTRGVIKTSDGGAGEAGLLVRAIPSATAQPVSIAAPVTVADGGGSLTVDGSVSVSNFPATQPVSTTQLPAALVTGRLDVNLGSSSGALPVTDNGGSITVDGPLTDAELRAAAVPVSGTFFQATQPVSIAVPVPVTDNGGSLTVDGTVAVSGSVAVTGPLTDAQLRASAVPISATQLPVALVGGRLDVNIGSGASAGTEYTEGDTDASITGAAILWEDSADTLRAVSAAKPLPVNIVAGAASGTEYTEGDVDGTITGTAIMWEDTGNTLKSVSAANPLPVSDAGGSLTVDGTVAVSGSVAVTGPLTDTQLRASAVPVSGTFFQGTQPISAAALPLPAGAATEATLAAIDAGVPAALGQTTMAASMPVTLASNQSALAVTGTFFQATQPVSVAAVVHVDDNAGSLTVDGSVSITGSVAVTGPLTDTQLRAAAVPISAAALPLPAGAATEATLAAIDAGVPAALGQTTMAASMPVTLASNQSALAVTGTFFQATQPVSIAASVAVTGPLTDAQLRAAAVPISAAALPLPAGAATLAAQTQPGVDIGDVTINNAAGVSAVNIQDGGNTITVDGTVGISGSVAVTGPLTDTQLRASAVPVSSTQLPVALVGGRLDVNIGSGSSAGTEYIEGDVDATIAGGAIMWEDTSDTLRAVSAAKPLPVTIIGAGSVVTNAGVFAVQDSEKVADNAAFTDGTTKVQPAGFILDETAGSTPLTEDDAAAARVDIKRSQIHVIEDATVRGRRAEVFSSGAIRTANTEANDLLMMILLELRETRRVLCDEYRVNYENVTE